MRAAGLRALARVGEEPARAVAVEALGAGESGCVSRAAADVLGAAPLRAAEREPPAAIALARTAGQRLRALRLLRRGRCEHFATMLGMRDATGDELLRDRLAREVQDWLSTSGRIGRAPDGELRRRLERLLATLSAGQRRQVEFVLRTSR